jgi:hypothetical protein
MFTLYGNDLPANGGKPYHLELRYLPCVSGFALPVDPFLEHLVDRQHANCRQDKQ